MAKVIKKVKPVAKKAPAKKMQPNQW